MRVAELTRPAVSCLCASLLARNRDHNRTNQGIECPADDELFGRLAAR